jgi:aryl-alcohol dehydrogenase-like predicted oxidoreductase
LPILETPFEKIKLAPGLPETPPFGIGTWAWGNGLYWSLGSSKIDQNDLDQAFQYCVDSGISLFDTAEVYSMGRSEKTLGKFLNGTQSILKSVALYQMHWPRPGVSIETWMNVMADAVEDGLIKAVGVSNYDLDQTQLAYEALDKRGIKLASNQIPFNLIQRQNEHNGLLNLCMSLNVKVIAYSPLAQGILTGKFGPDNPPPGIRGVRANDLEKYQELLDAMSTIAKAHQSTPGQVALNWTLCKDTIPIPGIKSLAQAKDNIQALTWRLSEDEIQELDQLSFAV